MIKLIYNFIFILLIFIIATAIPLSFDLIQFRISNATPQIDLPQESFEDPVKISETLELTIKSIDSKKFTLEYESTIPLTAELIENYFFLNLIGERGNVFEIPLFAEQFNPLTQTISFEKLMLDLPEDFYTISLMSTNKNHQVLAPENLMISLYKTHYTYSPFRELASSSLPLFTLYFPSENFDYLIPFSAHLRIENNRWRTAYHALMNMSLESYPIADGSWLPHSNNIRWANNEVYIHWDKLPKNKSVQQIQMIQKSLAETFFSFPNSVRSDAVNFHVRNGFQGLSAYESLEKSHGAQVFIPHLNNDHAIFFVPFKIPTLESEKEEVKAIWDTLAFQTDQFISYESMPIQIIYPRVSYQELEIKGQMVTINLEPSSLEAYLDNPLDFKLMVDALVHSFTSIKGIERVQFLIDGDFIDESWYEGISSPLEPTILNFISF